MTIHVNTFIEMIKIILAGVDINVKIGCSVFDKSIRRS